MAIEELREVAAAPNRVPTSYEKHRFLFLIIVIDLVFLAGRVFEMLLLLLFLGMGHEFSPPLLVLVPELQLNLPLDFLYLLASQVLSFNLDLLEDFLLLSQCCLNLFLCAVALSDP